MLIKIIFDTLYLIGVILAIVVSWELQHSVLWSTIYGCLGWVYIIVHFGLYPVLLILGAGLLGFTLWILKRDS